MQLNSEISQVVLFNACLYKETHGIVFILQSELK